MFSFSWLQRTLGLSTSPGKHPGGGVFGQSSRPRRGVPAPERSAIKYQEWVALQPLWIAATVVLPHNTFVIYGSVPVAVIIVWAWRRRLLPSPTIIGMTAFPAIAVTVVHIDVSATEVISGPMTIHKVIVSGVLLGVYGAKAMTRVTSQVFWWCVRTVGGAIAGDVASRLEQTRPNAGSIRNGTIKSRTKRPKVERKATARPSQGRTATVGAADGRRRPSREAVLIGNGLLSGDLDLDALFARHGRVDPGAVQRRSPCT